MQSSHSLLSCVFLGPAWSDEREGDPDDWGINGNLGVYHL